jgi:hypothetical protein
MPDHTWGMAPPGVAGGRQSSARNAGGPSLWNGLVIWKLFGPFFSPGDASLRYGRLKHFPPLHSTSFNSQNEGSDIQRGA